MSSRRNLPISVPEEQPLLASQTMAKPRLLTTADIPTIVSAVLEARDNQTSVGASAARDADSSSDDRVASSGDPAAVSVNNGALMSPVQASSEGTPDFGKLS